MTTKETIIFVIIFMLGIITVGSIGIGSICICFYQAINEITTLFVGFVAFVIPSVALGIILNKIF